MKNTEAPPAGVAPLEATVRPTHWKDARGYVLTDEQRKQRGADWELAYDVPCRVAAFGRIVPLYKCDHCRGKARDPAFTHDPCPACGRSGGAPSPNAKLTGQGGA